MTLAALAFFFVVVCNPDHTACGNFEDASDSQQGRQPAPWWRGWDVDASWDEFGPYFTREDCAKAAEDAPLGTEEVVNPWGVGGESACYAREIRVEIP